MKYLLIASAALFLVACSAEPGSEKWCEEKKAQPKSQWTAADDPVFCSSPRRLYCIEQPGNG